MSSWVYNNDTGNTIAHGRGQLAETFTAHDGHDIRVNYGYDFLGRPSTKTTVIDGLQSSTWLESTTYDQFGRVFQQFDATGSDYGVQMVYKSNGHLQKQLEARFTGDANPNNDTVYYEVLSTDARGNVTQSLMNGDITTNMGYDADDGQLNAIMSTAAGLSGANAIQDITYQYDLIGNLEFRHDLSGAKNIRERFVYDNLNRMTASYVTSPTINGGGELQLESANYDLAGNLTQKSGTSYQYGGSCNHNSNAGPHAVCSKGGISFTYDHAGNMVSDLSGRTIDYSVFNKPLNVNAQGQTTSYWYGADRGRFLRINGDGVTYFLGNVELNITNGINGQRTAKRYLGNFAIHDVNLDDGSIDDLSYTHRDHLGSMDVTTKVDESGVVSIENQFSFSAWGERRDAGIVTSGLNIAAVATLRGTTPRGFTNHEHIDHAGIIHMNGRIYDASLGRFLQADPVVQAPENTQNYSRYTYVLNNPLSYTDPSGYFFKSIGKFLKRSLTPITDIRSLAVLAITVAAPALGAGVIGKVIAGAAAGFVGTGSIRGALAGAFSALAFHAVGEHFAGLEAQSSGGLSFSQSVGKAITHGIVGGIANEIRGGKFGHGFVSAGVTQAFSQHISSITNVGGLGSQYLDFTARVAAAAALGGTVSELTGGKFVNGAATGAFSRAFNDEGVHNARSGAQNDEALVDHTIGDHAFSDKQVRDFLKDIFSSQDQREALKKHLRFNQDQISFAIGLAGDIRFGTELGQELGQALMEAAEMGIPLSKVFTPGQQLIAEVGSNAVGSFSELAGVDSSEITPREIFQTITGELESGDLQKLALAYQHRSRFEELFPN
jgi:RHS repeat-associated protein